MDKRPKTLAVPGKTCYSMNIEKSTVFDLKTRNRYPLTWGGRHDERTFMSKTAKTSAEGRRCKYPHCRRLLSIYNHQDYCHIHLEKISGEGKTKPYRHL